MNWEAINAISQLVSSIAVVFSERFRKFVDTLEPPADQKTVGALFGQEKPNANS